MTERRYSKTFIRNWREKRGLSLRQLANRMETEPGGEPIVSHASIGRIENGEQPYSQPILEAMAKALNVQPWMLLEMDPTKEGGVEDLVRRLPKDKQREALRYLRFLANG